MTVSRPSAVPSAAFGGLPMCRPVPRRAAVRVVAEAEAPAGIETKGPNMKALKDIQEIMNILPHRCGTASIAAAGWQAADARGHRRRRPPAADACGRPPVAHLPVLRGAGTPSC